MNRDDKDRAVNWIDRLKMESVRMEIQAQQIANQKAATESAVDNSPGLKAARRQHLAQQFQEEVPIPVRSYLNKIQITYSENNKQPNGIKKNIRCHGRHSLVGVRQTKLKKRRYIEYFSMR